MQLLTAIGGGLFLVICVVGGLRLLLLAHRTRQLPERVLGLGLFLMGGIGMPAIGMARSPLELSDTIRWFLMVVQGVVLAIGYAGFARFTQQVFRPDERWARIAARFLPVATIAGVAVMAVEPDGAAKVLGRTGDGALSLGYLGQQIGGILVLSWTAAEALRYATALRRRLRLADAVVVNRVQLWGSAMGLAAGMAVITTVGQLVGVDPMATTGGMGAIACLGIVAAGSIYLAFLPPHFYTAWVSTNAGAS